MFSDVFVQTGRDQLFHSEPQLALNFIDSQHLGLHELADFHYFLRMIDALLRAHIADMNHPLDAFSKLHECAELRDADDLSLIHI